MIVVDSSAIRAVGYAGSSLFIQFTSGLKVYEFPGVPFDVFLAFPAARSKGDFYNDHIRGRYG